MRRTTLLALMMGIAIAASAQNFMRIHNADGTVTTIPVESIQYIDFDSDDSLQPEAIAGEANCYIVDHEDRYTFRATHVDGSPIEDIDHVSWLWREKAEKPVVDDDVTYDAETNTVSYTAGAAEGNAVLAAVDMEGQILWIWHIWSTDRPIDKMMNSTRIMDRNLGAVSANEADGRDTWGLVYQYGRNVPFYFIGDDQEYDPKDAMKQANAFTEINPEFNIKWSVSSSQLADGYTLEESMANPMTHMMHKYFYGSNGGYHWAKDAHVFGLVWGNADFQGKTNFDPCPKGYKVPFAEQLDFSSISYQAGANYSMKQPISGFYIGDQWWPMNTGRHFEDGCALFGGESQNYCDRLFLWTAFAGPYTYNALTTYKYCPLRVIVENDYTKGTLKVTSPTAGTGAFGHAVRCVREEVSETTRRYSAATTQPCAAADIALTLADGTGRQLADIIASAGYTLLYFNNPDCVACHETKAAMEHSPVLNAHIADGTLKVVSIYTDDDAELWRAHRADYSTRWTVAIDAEQRVVAEGLYDVSRTPALYLIDNEGHILLADAPLTAVEALLN